MSKLKETRKETLKFINERNAQAIESNRQIKSQVTVITEEIQKHHELVMELAKDLGQLETDIKEHKRATAIIGLWLTAISLGGIVMTLLSLA